MASVPDSLQISPRMRVLLVAGGLLLAVSAAAFLLAPLVIPILLAFVFYAVLEPVSSRLMARGMSASAASLSVLLMLVIAIVGAMSWVLPQFSAQAQALHQRLPHLWQMMGEAFERISQWTKELTGLSVEETDLVGRIAERGDEWGQAVLVQAPSLLLSLVFIMLIAPLLTFFLVRDWKSLRGRMLDLLPNAHFELGWLIYERVARQLQRYVRGVIMQSAIVAVIASTGFWLLGIDTPLLFGVLAGILNVIPYIGPPLAMIPPAVSVLGDPLMDPWIAAWAAGVVLLAQLVDNLLVVPSLIAHSVNLHPLVVIVGIIIFGHFFGLLGMILAVPALAAAWIVLEGLQEGLRKSAAAQSSSS